MWRTLFTILYISAAVLANTGTQIVEIPDNVASIQTPETPELLTCPKGFDRVGMYCYHVSRKKTDRLGAIQICKRKKSDLAKPLTQDIDRLLRRYIAESRFKSVGRWIDITYNRGMHQWVLGTTTERIPYHGFVQKQSEMEIDQHCAVMAPKKSYAWTAQSCYTLNKYVCQTPRATVVSSTGELRSCPENFEDVDGICYHFSEEKEIWQDANESCQKMNSTLAQSITQDIDRQLRAHLASPRFDEVERWIDVRYNINTKKWVLVETNEEIPYDGFWEQESTKNPDKHCAIMQPKESYAWEPTICHNLKFAICEISLENVPTNSIQPDSQPLNLIVSSPACPKGFRPGGMNCYHVGKKKANWFDAIMVCRGKNSSLANPSTEDLNEQLRHQTAGFKQVERWIDVTYNEISQEWVVGKTGEKITYDGFREKPSDRKQDSYCAVVDPSKDFAWTPRMCYRRRHYVCQMPLRKLPEQSPEKLNSTSETIKKQETESHVIKTNGTLNRNDIPESSSPVIRRKKESSLSLKSPPETESSIKNVVKSQNSNVPDQPIENLPNSFTGNYRTESRVLDGEPHNLLIEPTRLTSNSFDTEFLFKP